MKQKSLFIVVATVALALLALIVVQLIWAGSSYRRKQEEIDLMAMHSLQHAVSEVESKATCFEMFSRMKINPGWGFYMLQQKLKPGTEILAPAGTSNVDTVNMFFLSDFNKDTNLYSFRTMPFSTYPAMADISLKFSYILDSGYAMTKSSGIENLTKADYLDKLGDKRPISKKVDVKLLDSLVSLGLTKAGFYNGYSLGIYNPEASKFEYVKNADSKIELEKSNIKLPLLKSKFLGTGYTVVLALNNRNMLALRQIMVLLIISAGVVLLLAFSSIYFIRTIILQKKLGDQKTDFINNMTHEFNTPISNIALALETIGERKLADEKPDLASLLGIVRFENNRLEENVDRLLQLGTPEKTNLLLKPDSLDIHKLLQNVVDNFRIRIASCGGKLELITRIEKSIIRGDETHIINVIYNLLDNAIKYCDTVPDIVIRTYNERSWFKVEINDNGIGIDKEDQKRIFEQFYRVPTGDVHNAKGFGLGLSYVKSIMDLHKGEIGLHSEPGVGTTFTLKFRL